jgi:hypothetical protein
MERACGLCGENAEKADLAFAAEHLIEGAAKTTLVRRGGLHGRTPARDQSFWKRVFENKCFGATQ